jgi:hypothetical protein
MKLFLRTFLVAAVASTGCGGDDDAGTPTTGTPPAGNSMSFFVSSAKNATGDLGGLAGADARCQSLAAAAGFGGKTWRAYLSVERDPANNNQPTDARSRIGNGPWFNATGAMVARDLSELHARRGDPAVFLDERGQMVPGNWTGSPRPNEHDILTGSTADGRVMAGMTCSDWTSASSSLAAQVGHSDGIGPSGDTSGTFSSWNSSHASQSCADTAPRGGAGRIYCFAVN